MRALSVLALLLSLASQAQPAGRRIQIGIAERVSALTLKPDGRFLLIDGAGGDPSELSANQAYKLKGGSFLKLGSIILSRKARLKPEDPADKIEVGPHSYRGDLILTLNKDETVTVVNELDIEDYLLGVLPREMDPGWPPEALKAQAVVARTFAYYNLGKFKNSGFDLTSDTRSQVYGVAGTDSEAVSLAVAQTRGEVLGYKGEILPAYYHACCGGHTTDTASVWAGAASPKPLRGVRDSICALSPHSHWTAYFPDDDILAVVQDRRMVGGRLRSFKVGQRDPAGYARNFIIKVGSEKIVISANELRQGLGAAQLKSTKISDIVRMKKGVEIEGGGSGHGVGLCQWGARLLADKGSGYEKILQHYFPGSTLSVIDE